jgi:precorrin-8X/cobalt-precorrin-8 methylmutase
LLEALSSRIITINLFIPKIFGKFATFLSHQLQDSDPISCDLYLHALQAGAFILTDTEMAKAAVAPMARRTLGTKVRSILEWAREPVPREFTRTSLGMQRAWTEMTFSSERPAPVVLIGSAPTALEMLLTIVEAGATKLSLVIGMPVGFVGML